MFGPQTTMSQATPSFLFSGLDAETRDLQADLESLGGGDSRCPNVGLHVVIDDIRGRRKSKILWQLDNFVGLRDPQMGDAAASTSMSYFSATSCKTTTELLSSTVASSSSGVRVSGKGPASKQREKAIPEELVDWVMSGFNTCLISHGARGAGKTLSMFGPKEHSGQFPKCLCRKMLEHLYASISNEDNVAIGLSCWALKRNNTIDLCEDTCTPRSSKKLAIIECRDLKTALKVLHTVRARCEGVEAVDPSHLIPEVERAHFFFRVVVFRPSAMDGQTPVPGSRMGTVSHIHLVDLIGSTPIEDRNFDQLSDQDRECRREVSLQHAAFARVLQQMRTASNKAANESGILSDTPLQITSARDSKLTMMLAPLMQGNVKTSVLLFLKDHESQYKHCKSTLSSMRDINEIVSACHIPSQRVDKMSLEMRHPDRVMTPRPQNYGSIQKHWNDEGLPSSVKSSGTPLIDLLQPKAGRQDSAVEEVGKEVHARIRGTAEKLYANQVQGGTNKVDRVMNEFHELMTSIQSTVGVDNCASSIPRGTVESYEGDSISSQDSIGNGDMLEQEAHASIKRGSQVAEDEEPTLLSLAAEPMEGYTNLTRSEVESKEGEKSTVNIVRSPFAGGSGSGSGHHPSSSSEELDEQDQLYGTTQGLMEALYKEKQARVAAEGHLVALKDEYLERLTAKEVEFDEVRVEMIRLKTKLRQVSVDKNIQDVYSTFEEDLKRMSNENDTLRRRNLALEEKCLALESEEAAETSKLAAAKARVSRSVDIDISSSERWLVDEVKKNSTSTLKTKLREMSRDNIVLKSENEEFRKRERQYLVAERTVTENSHRMKNLSEEFQKSRRALQLEKELTARLQSEILTLRGHRSQQEETENLLQAERARLQRQVSLLQQQVMEVCEDKRNVDKLTRFIEKHSPSSPLSKPPQKASNPKHRDLNDFSEPPRHLSIQRPPVRSSSSARMRAVGASHAPPMGGGRLSSFKNLMSNVVDERKLARTSTPGSTAVRFSSGPTWQ